MNLGARGDVPEHRGLNLGWRVDVPERRGLNFGFQGEVREHRPVEVLRRGESPVILPSGELRRAAAPVILPGGKLRRVADPAILPREVLCRRESPVILLREALRRVTDPEILPVEALPRLAALESHPFGGLQTAEVHAVEQQRGDAPARREARVVAHFGEVAPERDEVAGDVHLRDGLRQLAPFDEEAFDAVGEIARCRVAVPAVEAGHEDAFVDGRHERVAVLRAERHRQDGGRADGLFHLHFIGRVGVDVVSLQDARVEDRQPARGDSFAVEVARARRLREVRLVGEGQLRAHHFLVQLVQEEGVLLLDGRAVKGVDDGREEARGVHVVYHHRVLARACLALSQLAQHPFQCLRAQALLLQRVEIEGGIVPVGFWPRVALAFDAEAGDKAVPRAGRFALEAVAGYHILEIFPVAVGRVGGNDAGVLAHHLLADGHRQRELVVRLHGVEFRVEQPEVCAVALVIERGVGEGAGLVFRQEAGRGDAVEDEAFQLLFIQAVRGERAVAAVDEEVDDEAVLRRLLQTVRLHVAYLERAARTVVDAHARGLATVFQGKLHGPLCQLFIFFCNHPCIFLDFLILNSQFSIL